jgi:hypothetical protein
MKANISVSKAFSWLVCISIFVTACEKEKPQAVTVDPNATITSERSQAIAKTNNLILQAFTRDSRTYHFYYSPNGMVDSIVATGDDQYVYRAWYKGNHLDSVILLDDGRIVSVHRNFQYKGDLIVGYDYFDRIDNYPFPWSSSVLYDAQKRIVSIQRAHQNNLVGHQQWTYNANNDVVNRTGFGSDDGSYGYDSKLNPLHMVPDLFVLFVEESYIWEYSFSEHNSISKTIVGRPTLTYTHQYNGAGQLATKTFTDYRTHTFSFTYQ